MYIYVHSDTVYSSKDQEPITIHQTRFYKTIILSCNASLQDYVDYDINCALINMMGELEAFKGSHQFKIRL